MFVAMNRFKVISGREPDFEDIWKNRKSSLHGTEGFVSFYLLRGRRNESENYTLYASQTVWKSEADFVAWTKSRNFRDAHRNAGENLGMYLGPPDYEGFTAVEGA